MSITLNGTTGITTPDLTSAAPMDIGGSAVLTAASSLAAANLTGSLPAIDGSAVTSLTSANLTGALPAIDGSALSGVGASTTAGAVGTYTHGRPGNNTHFAFGDTSSSIYPWEPYAGFNYYEGGSASPFKGFGGLGSILSGTWRCMSIAGSSGGNGFTGLWVRIS